MAMSRSSYLALALALLACNSAASDDDGEVIAGELDGACPLNQRVGLFSVAHEPDYSAIDGELNDALLPTMLVDETLSIGGCRLLEPINPFCDPACSPGQVCDPSGVCVPYPSRVELGEVEIRGLVVDVVMQPRADARYFETELPQPVFEPGSAIALTSSGSAQVGPLELYGRGFAPLELVDESWSIVAGQPLHVQWLPDAGGEAGFSLSINIDQHGVLPVTLVCEGPDTGSFEIPSEAIDALITAGVSGFPVAHAYRRTIDSAASELGCVEFQVRSHRSVEVEVAGHTPCTSDAECSGGQTCDLAQQTCV